MVRRFFISAFSSVIALVARPANSCNRGTIPDKDNPECRRIPS
jgi:hypothetical protein